MAKVAATETLSQLLAAAKSDVLDGWRIYSPLLAHHRYVLLLRGSGLGGHHRRGLDLEQHAVERQPRHRNERAGRLGRIAPSTIEFGAEHVKPLFAVVDDEHQQP